MSASVDLSGTLMRVRNQRNFYSFSLAFLTYPVAFLCSLHMVIYLVAKKLITSQLSSVLIIRRSLIAVVENFCLQFYLNPLIWQK